MTTADPTITTEIYQTATSAHNLGRETKKIILINKHGTEVHFCNLGLTLLNFFVNDQNGHKTNIVLGCDTLKDYEEQTGYLGAFIGRYGNRIHNGEFSLGDASFSVSNNEEGRTHLHGGHIGFDKVIWNISSAEVIHGVPTLVAEYFSPDKEEGYPGNLNCKITITLSESNELNFELRAVSDSDTHVNLTHHGYFNLTGETNHSLDEHQFRIHSDEVTEVDSNCIPTGKYVSVTDTILDFSEFKSVSSVIHSKDPLVVSQRGIDHNFVFKKENSNKEVKMAEVYNPNNGITLTVSSDQPGVQFYTAQHLQGAPARDKQTYNSYTGFCLEPQHFPDSPNHSHFPSTLLKAGDEYYYNFKFAIDT